MSSWAQLERDAPRDFELARRMKEKQRAYADPQPAGKAAKGGVSECFEDAQTRIRTASLARQAVNGKSLDDFIASIDSSDDEQEGGEATDKFVQPTRLHQDHHDHVFTQRSESELADLELEEDGKIYYPNSVSYTHLTLPTICSV